MKQTAYTARIGLKDQLSIIFVSNYMTRVGLRKWSRGNRTSQQLMGPIFFFCLQIFKVKKFGLLIKKHFWPKGKLYCWLRKKKTLSYACVFTYANPMFNKFCFYHFYIILNVNTFWDLITGFSFFFLVLFCKSITD